MGTIENEVHTFASACNACGSTETSSPLVAANTHGRHVVTPQPIFTYARCSGCGNLYLASFPTSCLPLEQYYPDDYYESGNSSILASALANLSYARKCRLIRRHSRAYARPRILDVGCGDGSFIESLPKDQFDAHGLEPNAVGAATCKEKGLRVTHGKIENLESDSRFDVITMWHVLEHIEDPSSQLKRCRDLLSDDGVLIVAVPNIDALGARLGAAMWFHLDAPRHLFLPSERSMTALAHGAHLTTTALRRDWCEYPLDLFWSLRRHPLKYMAYPLYPFFKLLSAESLTFVFKKDASGSQLAEPPTKRNDKEE